MAAVIGLPDEQVEQLCAGIEGVWPANYNCPGQLVVSGTEAGVAALIEAAQAAGARRALRLNVSGGFHSPLTAVGRAAAAPGARGGHVPRPGDAVLLDRHHAASRTHGADLAEILVAAADRAGAVHAGRGGAGRAAASRSSSRSARATCCPVSSSASTARVQAIAVSNPDGLQKLGGCPCLTSPGRVTLVTGGSRGIGRAISLELARAGARVARQLRRPVRRGRRGRRADQGGRRRRRRAEGRRGRSRAGGRAGRARPRRRSATTSGTSSATPASRATTSCRASATTTGAPSSTPTSAAPSTSARRPAASCCASGAARS